MIRWITQQLGTAPWNQVTDTDGLHLLDVRDLVDRGGNTVEAVGKKIADGTRLLQEGRRVVVCCDYGMSRSNSIAAGILKQAQGISLEEAIRAVLQATGETAIKIEVLAIVRQALNLNSGHPVPAEKKSGRVIVTGASGFIGQRLLSSLAGEFEPLPVFRSAIDLMKGTVPLDLLARESGARTLLHLANSRIYTTNESLGESLGMLKNVLDVCRENSLRLVYLSSWEVYSGYRARQMFANEQLALYPGGTYGQTKYLAEMLIQSYRQLYSLEVLILRPSPVYGVGSERPMFIRNFLRKALKNAPITTHRYRNGLPSLDLLHLSDLVRALPPAVTGDFTGSINLGTGRPAITSEVAQYLVEAVGSQSVIEHLDIDGHASNVVLDNGRAKQLLDWTPQISWEDGVKEIIAEERVRNLS